MSRFIRTTLIGGVIFLLPLVLIVLILRAGFRVAGTVSTPVIGMFPDVLGDRVLAANLLAAGFLLALAFIAGLFARTGAGQRMIQWFENSVIGSLPQFNFVRGIAESMGGTQKVEVVLVPTDAGWNLAFVFEPGPGPWLAVFIPGAPEWTSGSVAWSHVDTIRKTGLNFTQALLILRKLGVSSAAVAAALTAADGAQPDPATG